LVPADARVIEISSSSLKVDQSILTGEPISVEKQEQAIKDTKAVKQDQVNILFSGTTVTVGKCIACVVHTGANTAIGQIHCDIQDHDDEKTPLKIQLDEFGDQLAKIISVVCILVWLINIRHFTDESHGKLILM
jgi:Ca2+ transporting ATPase